MKEASAEVGEFKIGGRIINKVKFADDTSAIAKTQEETWKKYGIEFNIDKSQIMSVSRSNESLQIK